MESLCDYSMYFPAAPVSSLSDPAEYTRLPRRGHVYLGETIQFLLVLRSRDTARKDDSSSVLPWKDLGQSLWALPSVCVAETRQKKPGEIQPDAESSGSESTEEERAQGECVGTPGCRTFTRCDPLLTHSRSAAGGRHNEREPVKAALVLDDQIAFFLTISLDKLPVNTLKAKGMMVYRGSVPDTTKSGVKEFHFQSGSVLQLQIIVTVWKQEEEKVEVREHGYLTLLQLRSPAHTFRQDLSTFKAQVNTTLNVLPPPSVQCQQMTVSGKHLILLKVLNYSSLEEVCIRDVKILPNYNSSYLPMMPDGSVLIVDNVCHQSAEVTMASFYRIDSESSSLPSTLGSLEEQNFLFQLQLQNTEEEDSSEGLEVPLVAVLQWCTPALPLTQYISSCYLLPSIRLNRPQLVMTASCPRAVRPLEHFWVKYTLLNNLQDFLTVHLIWNSEAHRHAYRDDSRAAAVVCQSPLNNLGQCRKGSTLSFTVAFQILRTGVFELSQHMKLKLQFTASVSPPPPLVGPQSPSSSSPRPVAKELLERRGLGRSQSFSHQQPPRSHHVRSGSVMEPQTITPPVGTVDRTLHLPPDHTLISLDKIAKRECKVLVLEAVQEEHCR